MIKPRTQNFRVKVMLIKLEAVNNRVATRCHATIMIDGNEQSFKANPQLKKNVALFNSEVEFEHLSIQLDEVTGLYQQKPALLQLEIETQGTRMKMGEVLINLGGVLNDKKYRMVNQYPLGKCYDKTAKVRLSVDFIPIGGTQSYTERKEKRQMKSLNPSQVQLLTPLSANKQKRSGPLKSRLAEQSNVILQERIFEYQQKMENYRLSQTQLQEKLHEQISNKDDKISELTLDLNRKSQQLSAANLEMQQLRFKIKQHNQEIYSLKEQKRNLILIIQNHEKTEQSLKEELSTTKTSLDNISRTKQNKEKYYTQEISKYTAKYLQSQQERNKIIFELQSKFKEEIDKKQNNYRNIITNTEKKYEQLCKSLKEKVKNLESQLESKEEQFEDEQRKNQKAVDLISIREKELDRVKMQYDELFSNMTKLKQSSNETGSQLQTLNFSYNQLELEVQKQREQNIQLKRNNQQLKMELMMANQTIQQQYKSITKYGKELQVHQEREYFLTQKYNDQLQIKSINEENIRGETIYYREEIHILKNKLSIAQQRADDENNRANQLAEAVQRIENELTQRSQTIMRLGEQKMSIENEVKGIRSQLADMEEAVLVLKEENMQLNEMLNEKKEALENDKSLEWSYKIEQLQNDISQMVQKFRVEKDSMRQVFRREQTKKKQEVNHLNLLLRKTKDELEEQRKNNLRKQAAIKQYEKKLEGARDQLKAKAKQFDQLNQKLRHQALQSQQMDKKKKNHDDDYQGRIHELESKISQEIQLRKKMELNKTGLQKLIQSLLELMARPMQTVVSFQELFVTDVQIEFINLVNLSVKKYYDQRAKIRESIKRLETEIEEYQKSHSNNQFQLQAFNFREKIQKAEKVQVQHRAYQSQNQSDSWRQSFKPSNYELDEARDENARLKREISELKMKVRTIQEEVSKAERNTDAERHDKNEAKRQLQQSQDEVDRLNFQLKRKEKQIIELESELRQFQSQTIPQQTIFNAKPKIPPSRAQLRQRQKQDNLNNNRKDILIKQLENRLENKTKEVEEMLTEMSKLRGENTSRKQALVHLTNECKFLQGKCKDKSIKYANSQAILIESKNRLEDELNKALLQHKQEIQSLGEQLMQVQEENIQYQRNIEQLTSKLEETQRKLKSARQDSRTNENRSKKEYEVSLSQLKNTINELQSNLAKVQSQKEQLLMRVKEEAMRSGSQGNMLSKRSQEIERLIGEVRAKQQEIFELEQAAEITRSQHEAKLLEMQECIEELELACQKKEYELEECKFVSEGKILDLERQLEEIQHKS